jgi:hypothetical protein
MVYRICASTKFPFGVSAHAFGGSLIRRPLLLATGWSSLLYAQTPSDSMIYFSSFRHLHSVAILGRFKLQP